MIVTVLAMLIGYPMAYVIAFRGGRLDFMVTTIPSVFGFLDSGKLRPLAVTSRTRWRP